MSKTTLLLAASLVIIGISGYVGTRMVSVTALIPAFFGLPIFILDFTARRSASQKAFVLGAAILSILGFFGSMRGVFQLIAGSFSTAVLLQTLMFLICAIYSIAAVKFLKGLSKKDAGVAG